LGLQVKSASETSEVVEFARLVRYYLSFMSNSKSQSRSCPERLAGRPGRGSLGAKGRDAAGEKGRIDLRKLAQAGRTLNSELDLASCDRLVDRLAHSTGTIAYRITGGRDTHGWPTATIALEGVVPLVCQRCLQPFGYRLEHEGTVRLASSERELEAWDAEEIEAMLAVEPVDRGELIEDELLLCLPYAPMHAPEDCPVSAETKPEPEGKQNPFGQLAQLKKR